MVGKIKHVRQKIHQDAVKLTTQSIELADSGLTAKSLAFNLTRPAPREGKEVTDTSKKVCIMQPLPALGCS